MSKIRQKDIRGFKARYHRNGTMGEGFFVCDFKFGKDFTPLKAIVFYGRGRVAIISENSDERYCGDDFEDAIRQAIALQQAAQPEAAYG